MTRSLTDALGGMRNIAQWFVWRLTWDAEEGKYAKMPTDGSIYRMDASLPSNWMRHESAVARVAELRAASSAPGVTYALGFWMTADCGYWFLDLDKCVDGNGELLPLANSLIAAFPGALLEWSSSRKGAHIIGRGHAPEHRNKPKRELKKALAPLELEFYTQDRGIAFGLDDVAAGSADDDKHDANIASLCAQYFPPRAPGDTADRRAEWRGPADDETLIERMLNARQSAEAAFGGKASLKQLWLGQAEQNSESDMALASHLAFWTGCDEERIERLMRRSGLVREKWNDRRPGGTYLTFTIANACAGTEQVYQEPQRSVAVQSEMYGLPMEVLGSQGLVAVQHAGPSEVISPEVMARVEAMMDLVTGCGTLLDMHNQVIPAIRQANIPAALGEPLIGAVLKQLDIWNARIPKPKLRSLLFPPVVAGSAGGEDAPLWVQRHCYVKDGDYFMDMENGSTCTYQGFIADHARLMPLRDNGTRENPVEWAFNRWGMRTVHKVGYRPDQPIYYTWDGLEYANNYNPNSVPPVAEGYTEAGIAGIQALQQLIWHMTSKREGIYFALLQWFAHNVQYPGIKIRWSPVIKGTPGDAKSILSNVLRAAMGYRNVGVTGNNVLRNTGGFTDWAFGKAVNVIEEIWLVGKERHVLYNATKEFITNDIVSINPKGKTSFDMYNTTNHMAYTNHNDAIPLEKDDRRWLVIFTPWESLDAMYGYYGMPVEGWRGLVRAVDHAWRHCGSELRRWFLSIPVDAFDKDGSAALTPERELMIASSVEDAESVAAAIIADGSLGITKDVLSSNLLGHALKIRSQFDGFELPRGQAMNHMLTRMGYSKFPKQFKWNNATHTIWVKNGFNGDIRADLDATRFKLEGTQTLLKPT